MILRIWFGRTSERDAQRYAEHVVGRVVPTLTEIPGHRGALVLRRETEGETEFAVLTKWDSMDAVKRFAGPQPDLAVVEPAAREMLSDFDEHVRHFDVIYES